MRANVGSNDQYVRLALAAAAGIAATRTEGLLRTVLAGVALTGLFTGLARYCPLSEALGIDTTRGDYPASDRDTELRRQTAVNSALGQPPTAGSDVPRVTEGSDAFGRV